MGDAEIEEIVDLSTFRLKSQTPIFSFKEGTEWTFFGPKKKLFRWFDGRHISIRENDEEQKIYEFEDHLRNKTFFLTTPASIYEGGFFLTNQERLIFYRIIKNGKETTYKFIENFVLVNDEIKSIHEVQNKLETIRNNFDKLIELNRTSY